MITLRVGASTAKLASAAIVLLLSACVNDVVARNQVGEHKASPVNRLVAYSERYGFSQNASANIEVIDRANMVVFDADIHYLLNRDSKYKTEFDGRIKWCSNDEYYCVQSETSLYMAFPKDIDEAHEMHWHFLDMDCESSDRAKARHLTTIFCRYNTFFSWIVYSPGRGVISYTTSISPTTKYDLIGKKGLFAKEVSER